MAWSLNRQAAKTIALAEDLPPADRRHLMAMLGILDDTGRDIRPDTHADLTTTTSTIMADLGGHNSYGGSSRSGHLTHLREPLPQRHRHNLPPGLRNPPEPAPEPAPAPPESETESDPAPPLPDPEPKPKAKRAPRKTLRIAVDTDDPLRAPTTGPLCGKTLGGRTRHQRRHEALCDPCQELANEYQRQRRALIRASQPAKRRERAACGSANGAKGHRRRGEEICQPCLEARRAAGREWWNRKQAARRVPATEEDQQLDAAS